MTNVSQARELLRQGRIDEAERAYELALERSPDNIEALNILAIAALRDGQPSRALELLRRATQTAPQDALSLHHLGQAHEACGDRTAALAAHESALRLKPDLYAARLHLASLLETTGKGELAIVQFARALHDAQSRGAWLNGETTPPRLQPLVAHAAEVVRNQRRAALAALLDPLEKRYGRDALSRVERCLRGYFKEVEFARPDARQQPNFLYFPDLPAAPYLARTLFDWIEPLEAATEDIRSELLQLLPNAQGRERVFTNDELERRNLRGLELAPSWNGYYFFRHGERRDDNCEKCPATTRALEALPLSKIRDHAPEVLFSVFTPGTHLLPHRGVTNTRVVCHLPLIVPENCALNVGGELHHWQEGRVVVFDDTYEHEAWNRSAQIRVVMIFDIWNPHLSQAERAALAELVAGIGDFRKAMEAA